MSSRCVSLQTRNTGANTVDEIRRGARNFVAPCHENLSGPLEFRGGATKFVPSGSPVLGPILVQLNVLSTLLEVNRDEHVAGVQEPVKYASDLILSDDLPGIVHAPHVRECGAGNIERGEHAA
jgi:hypothetical protein